MHFDLIITKHEALGEKIKNMPFNVFSMYHNPLKNK